jgi:uncharacterized protein
MRWFTLVTCQVAVMVACSKTGTSDRVASNGSASVAQTTVITDLTSRCDRNDGEACRNLALIVTQGKVVAADPVRATALFRKACDLDSKPACNQFGIALAEGVGTAKDVVAAAAVLNKSCEAGNGMACRNLGVMLRDGKLGKPEPARAAELLAKACDTDVPFACTNLGDLLFNSLDDNDQVKLGIDSYQRGCKHADGTACRQLGLAYLTGRGLPQSSTAAAVWLRKACDSNDGVGCGALATVDPANAQELTDKACRLGESKFCAGSGSSSTH